MRQLEAIRHRTDLSAEERAAYIQQLYIVWYSQIRQDVDEKKAQQPLLLEDILQRLTGANPVAILLGTPGSGKTTFLRWIVLHMVRATRAELSSSTYKLPQGLGSVQVPLLIQTGEYAERLEKEQLTLKQFLIAQWNIIHPNLAVKLLEELRQGHSLILFDGLDQGTTFNVRRRVLENIQAFILEYSSDDSSNYNRFIVSSRIADSEPSVFTKYPHYTLSTLDESMVKQVLSKWCFALARYKAMVVKGMQPLVASEDANIRTVAAKRQEQLLHIFSSNSGLMSLSVSPATLTMMAVLQASGRDILRYRMELYEMVIRTHLDTWNRESGRKMFSERELPLAEQILSSLAYHLQVKNAPLTKDEVIVTTRQITADFSQLRPVDIFESDIVQFIETLRRSSGLLAEGGDNLFYFANRTFQDYFVVLYLLHMPIKNLKQVAIQHHSAVTWHEALLLTLTYKSKQKSLEAIREVDEVLQAIIADTHNIHTHSSASWLAEVQQERQKKQVSP